ncbi:MAG: DegT/DnrJ/EryC1/StrS family aminotransferase [bacterium]
MQLKHTIIPSIGPSITNKEIQLVLEAIETGWYEQMNKYIHQFAQEFSAFAGKKYCLPVSHGTAAVHLAFLGLNIGRGDEVIVPDITWVASAAPLNYVGAKIVFADIDQKNWCISPQAFERSITNKTKAVVVVDLFGNMPDMQEIKRIAQKHRILIIEDAAEAIGAQYHNQPAGSFGKIGVYSFNATKLTIAGQGGMVVTDDKKVFEKMKMFAHHGILKKPNARYYWSHHIGFNYNWTNIQAALALAQLRRLDELLSKRRQIFTWYAERLADIDGIQLNNESRNVKNSYWITVALINKKYKLKKEVIQAECKKYNIDVRPFFYPLSSMPAFAPYCRNKNMRKINPVSYEISPYGICLPSGATLSEKDVDYVCMVLRNILLKRRS